MDRFAFGKDNQYAEFKRTLQDGHCHVFQCSLPSGFNRSSCRIGFEKCLSDHRSFKILIDRGITYTGCKRVSPLLKIWLQAGELTFLDYNDLKVFLQALKRLY